MDMFRDIVNGFEGINDQGEWHDSQSHHSTTRLGVSRHMKKCPTNNFMHNMLALYSTLYIPDLFKSSKKNLFNVIQCK